MGFGRRRKYQPGSDPKTARRLHGCTCWPRTPVLAWSIEVREGRLQPRRDTADDAVDRAGCAVSCRASGVYLYLWNRADAARLASP